KRHRQRLIDFRDRRRFSGSFCQQWFREPLAEIYLPLYTRGLQLVDAETCDHGHHEPSGIPDLRLRCVLPPQERFLQHVLGIRAAAKHAISNREEQAPMLIERLEPLTFQNLTPSLIE